MRFVTLSSKKFLNCSSLSFFNEINFKSGFKMNDVKCDLTIVKVVYGKSVAACLLHLLRTE